MEDLRTRRPELYGPLIENFVASELLKLLSFSGIRATLTHFRTSNNKAVDFILERPDGSVAGIEVKRADRLNSSDFKGLQEFQQIASKDFICGIVLYSGKKGCLLAINSTQFHSLRFGSKKNPAFAFLSFSARKNIYI